MPILFRLARRIQYLCQGFISHSQRNTPSLVEVSFPKAFSAMAQSCRSMRPWQDHVKHRANCIAFLPCPLYSLAILLQLNEGNFGTWSRRWMRREWRLKQEMLVPSSSGFSIPRGWVSYRVHTWSLYTFMQAPEISGLMTGGIAKMQVQLQCSFSSFILLASEVKLVWIKISVCVKCLTGRISMCFYVICAKWWIVVLLHWEVSYLEYL